MINENRKVALVTGAAGGIGQVLTRRLIAADYHVLMLDINETGLEVCKASFGDAVTTLTCDVTDPDAVAAVSTKCKRLDVIVNNAGFIIPGPFLQAAPEAIEKQMQINLLGPIRILKALLPAVVAGGSVINIVSMAGILPLKDSSIYTAGKFGLRGLTLSLAIEQRERGIAVSGVYPSSVDTPMLRMEARSGGSPLNFIADPLSPEQVVDAVMRAIGEGKLEYYVPYSDGILSRVCNCLPWLLPKLLPHFERKGAAGKQKYLAKLQA